MARRGKERERNNKRIKHEDRGRYYKKRKALRDRFCFISIMTISPRGQCIQCSQCIGGIPYYSG